MVYFEIDHLGYNCGKIKDNCSKYPKFCLQCIKNKLKQIGFEVGSSLEVFEVDSYERRIQMERKLIWHKFLDVLNIRHVIIIDKESGLTLVNYSLTGEEINVDLLSGFIQANITFSESSEISYKKYSSKKDFKFYEFQYQNFNILLKDGSIIRLCLMLDHKASENLRLQVIQFIPEFEEIYNKELIDFRKNGIINVQNMIDYIVDVFEIKLVFPMILAHSIPPKDLENLNQDQIQKAIFNIVQELLTSKSFFFINNLLNKVKKIVNLDSNVILYQIYQLIQNKIIIPTNLEATISNIEMIQEAQDEKVAKYRPISPLIIMESNFEQLKLEDMDEDSALTLIKELIKKGKVAEKSLAYQISEKEYQKALHLAKEFNLKTQIDKISKLLLDLDKQVKQIELDFTLEAGENAEKNGDFINSIQYYQKALKILENFLIYNVSDSRIKKLKKKIIKLREQI